MSIPQQIPPTDLYTRCSRQPQPQWSMQLPLMDINSPTAVQFNYPSSDGSLPSSLSYPSSTDQPIYSPMNSIPAYSTPYVFTQPECLNSTHYSVPLPPQPASDHTLFQTEMSNGYSSSAAPCQPTMTSPSHPDLQSLNGSSTKSAAACCIEDPYTYALQNNLPLPPTAVPLPPSNTLSNALAPTSPLAYSLSTPTPVQASVLEPRGSHRWTPAKLYTTPLRRDGPPPVLSRTSSKASLRAQKDEASAMKAGGEARDAGAQSMDEDEVDNVLVRPRKKRAGRDGTIRSTSAPRSKRLADQAYVRALETNVERLKQQILGMGQTPFGLEGVNDTAAMSLDSAKLIIQAQQLDLDHVRKEQEEGKRENNQLRAAMNGTHAPFLSTSQNVKLAFASANLATGAPAPPISDSVFAAARRGSVESVSSSSSVESMTSSSSFDSGSSFGSSQQAGQSSVAVVPSIPSMQWTLWNQAAQGAVQRQGGGK